MRAIYLLCATFPCALLADDTLNLKQLSPRFSLRVLQKICSHPVLKAKNANAYTDTGRVNKLKDNLRLEMRSHMLDRSLELEKSMVYFYSHKVLPASEFPHHCSRARAADWSQALDKYQKLQALREHLRNTIHLRWRENMRTLLKASYETMFIKQILLGSLLRIPNRRNWQRPPFWEQQTDQIKVLSFPPIYPISLAKMQFGYPQERLQSLHAQFPILRWRDMEHLGTHGEMLDQRLFKAAFVDVRHGGSILARLKDDFRHKLAPLIALADKAQNEVQAIKINTVANNGLVLDRKQIANLRALQLYFIAYFANDIESYVNALDDATLAKVARITDQFYVDWALTQAKVRTGACEDEDYKIEEYRALLWSLLKSYDKEEGMDLLAAFCHHSWTRSKVKMLESGSQALYGALFVAGILSRKLRPAARVLAPATAAFSFVLRSAKGINTLRAERALMLLDKRQEDDRIYANGLNVIAIPATIVGLHFGSKAIVNAGAWRFFIPFRGWSKEVSVHASTSFVVSRYTDFRSHVDHKLNPIKTKNFWLNSADNVLGLLMGGHALIASGKGGLMSKLHATALFSLTYALFNVYVQNIAYLMFRDDTTPANHKFNNLWGTFHSGPRNVLEWSLFWQIHKFIPNNAAASAFTSAYKVVDSVQKKTWYAVAKLSYLKEDKNFSESLLHLPDYSKLLKGIHIPKDQELPSLAEINSLRELMHAYADKDSPLRVLVDVEALLMQQSHK
ncbi:MAG: hypothetical protein OYH77_00630 [Pseudomonadota bacterium]|nr:hypothetical protein [Pseudomonadota bacterium]